MATFRISCPCCGNKLKLPAEPVPGRIVQCPARGGHSFPYLPIPAGPTADDAPASSWGVPLAYAAGLALLGFALLSVLGMRAATVRAAQRGEPQTQAPSSGTSQSERPVLPHRHPANDTQRPGEPVSLPNPPSPPDRFALPPESQERVNAAIARGVAYLKQIQQPGGSWPNNGFPVAHAALAGLTLLECGVPADDLVITKAIAVVRGAINDRNAGRHTYTASLMLLFLDRLGDRADEARIRTLALRLVAGQNADGGWTYTLPSLSEDEEGKIMIALASTRPTGLGKIVMRPASGGGLGRIVGGGADPLGKIAGGIAPTAAEADRAVAALPPRLRHLPAFRDELEDSTATPPGNKKPRKGRRIPPRRFIGQISDNSNTQFGTLAMWAALRHGVPLERALQRLGERFRKSQMSDGNWGYRGPQRGTEAMTGVGLLGLAVAKGLAGDRKPTRDEDIERGLTALGKNIHLRGAQSGPRNLYFWWTVERVAMIYGIKEVGGKDWYSGAVELLLSQQNGAGWWQMGGYHGANRTLDTCFALLILKRVNLAPELTKTLELGLVLPK